MTTKEKIASTAPCGPDCFNCNSHEANITPEYRQKMSEFFGIPLDGAVCRGGRKVTGNFRGGGREVTGNCFGTRGIFAKWVCIRSKRGGSRFKYDGFPCERRARGRRDGEKPSDWQRVPN